jgi:ankyrin repeat protein
LANTDHILTLIQSGNHTALAKEAEERPDLFDDKHWYSAVGTGRTDICSPLVHAGLSPKKTRFDRTPLHFAAYFHKLDIVKWLLEVDADPNKPDGEGYKPLDLAYEFSENEPSSELVDALAGAGTEISIWTAVRMGRLDRCKSILEESPDRINAFSGGMALTPLMVAVRMNRLSIAQFLIESGANVNAVGPVESGDMGGNTVLWYAAQGGRMDREAVVELLLAHGAQVDVAGEGGWTALHMAAQWNHPGIARLLIEKGANKAYLDGGGRTPLEIAQKYESRDVVNFLSTLSEQLYEGPSRFT